MSLEWYVRNGELYSFSDTDMKKITQNKYNIYLYHDLSKYTNINDVLGSNKGAIILFQNESANSGHWCCIWLDDNTLHFFDSYGLRPDDELQYSQYNLRIHNNKAVPHLSHLIDQSKYKLEWNKYKLQKMRDKTNTCGRYAGYRLLHRSMTNEDFAKLLQSNKYYDADFWVTLLTAHYRSFNSQ
jgi:hypothetical protein